MQITFISYQALSAIWKKQNTSYDVLADGRYLAKCYFQDSASFDRSVRDNSDFHFAISIK